MSGALGAVGAEAEATGHEMDNLGTHQQAAADASKVLSNANIDVAARMAEAKVRAENLTTSLKAHGVAAKDAESATAALTAQFAKQSIISDFAKAVRDSGESMRVLGPAVRSIASDLVNAQQATQNATPSFTLFGKNLDELGSMLSSLGQYVIPVLVGAMVSIGVAAAPLIVAFGAWAIATGAVAAGLASLTAIMFGALGPAVALGAAVFALGRSHEAQHGPLNQLIADWQKLTDHWGKFVLPLMDEIASAADKLLPLFQQVGDAVFRAFGAELPSLLGIVTPLLQTFVNDAVQPLLLIWAQTVDFVAGHKSDFVGFFDLLTRAGVGALQGLMTNLERFSGWFLSNWPKLAPIMATGFAILGQVVQGLGVVLGRVVTWVEQNWPAITKLAGDSATAFGVIFAAAGKLWELIANNLGPQIQYLTQHGRELTIVLGVLAAPLLVLIGVIMGVVYAGITLVDAFVRITVGAEQTAAQLRGAFAAAVDWVGQRMSQLGSTIQNAVGNLGGILYDAGRAVVTGLINGIESQIGALANAASNLGSIIAAHKGPLDEDLKLLVPHGQAIMAGLQAGIASGVPGLTRQLGGISGVIGATQLGAGVGSTPGLLPAVGETNDILGEIYQVLDDIRTAVKPQGPQPFRRHQLASS